MTLIKEELLHYVWRTKQFDVKALQTTTGLPVEIINFGQHNTDAGPDFLNARIRIGDTDWAGSIEMHIYSSDWRKHKHHSDAAYRNVILHVVWQDDEPVHHQAQQQPIPCVVLQSRITKHIITAYQTLLDATLWIPCQSLFAQVSELTKRTWLERMLVERLEQKTAIIETALIQQVYHWEEVFYQFLARSLGANVNADAMQAVAASLPQSILAKHKDNLFQIEALLFGQANLLSEQYHDAYAQVLWREYKVLKQKYQLTPISIAWKFMRMRPANFPTIRLAQLAMLIHQSSHLFSKILAVTDSKTLQELFSAEASEYWQTHYIFDEPSAVRKKQIGTTAVTILLINTVAPFLFLYGASKQSEELRARAIDLLSVLPPEKNSVIEQWRELGMGIDNSGQSQALLHLKKNYCDMRRCLQCAIGNRILKHM